MPSQVPAIFTSERDLRGIIEQTVPEFRSGRSQLVSCHVTGLEERPDKAAVLYTIACQYRQGADQKMAEMVAKVYGKAGPARKAYGAMRQLWHTGFRQPSRNRIPQPYGYAAGSRAVVMQKVHGIPWADFLYYAENDMVNASAAAADWLAQLHQTPLSVDAELPRTPIATTLLSARQLGECLPRYGPRLQTLAGKIANGLGSIRQLRPSFGNFAPHRVVVTPEYTSATDFDAVQLREPEADLGYAATQLLLQSRFRTGTFARGMKAADSFIKQYVAQAPVDSERISLYIADALLRGLHHEVCVLRNDRSDLLDPWFELVERHLTKSRPGNGSPAVLTSSTGR